MSGQDEIPAVAAQAGLATAQCSGAAGQEPDTEAADAAVEEN